MKNLKEMTNEELAHAEYIACMMADELCHETECDPDHPAYEDLTYADAWVEQVHTEIARRGLRAVTRNNFTVLVPKEEAHE